MMMDAWPPSFEEKKEFYRRCFTLAYFNTNIEAKFMLICLTCILTQKVNISRKAKGLPECKSLPVLKKIAHTDFPLDVLEGVSIICDDYLLENLYSLPDFGIKNTKQMTQKIIEILETYVPF